MGKKIKRALPILVVLGIMFAFTACASGLHRVDDNDYGGKTYGDGINSSRGETTKSLSLPKQFPSDKIPVLAEGKVGRYKAVYDKYEKLMSAELSMDTRKSSKEAIESYKEFYNDVEVIEDKAVINEYVEELTRYEYSFVKGEYTYAVTVSRSANVKYSCISVEMKLNQ